MKLRSLRTATLVAIGILIIVMGAHIFRTQREGYNLLLVTLDTTRADRIGCYGYKDALTPNIDRLAASGVLFEQCRTVAPLTLPSHATMMTGLLPPEHGIRINARTGLPPDALTLAAILKRAGYSTAAFVASSVLDANYGLDSGFDIYDDRIEDTGSDPRFPCDMGDQGIVPASRPANEVVEEAMQWLNREFRQPFFCWVHLYDAHFPYLPHPHIKSDFASNYDAEIAFADEQLGRLVVFIKKRHPGRRTVIVVVGDHGEDLNSHGEATHGLTLYDSVVHVPLIIEVPGATSGHRVTENVSTVDLLSTALDILNIRTSGWVDLHDVVDDLLSRSRGRSLATAILGPRRSSLSQVSSYSEGMQSLHEYGWAPQHCLTANNWKYIRSPQHELYDVRTDPAELNNLATSHVEKVKDMESELTAIEAGLIPGVPTTVRLSADDRARLRSLGYAAGGVFPSVVPPGTNVLRDVKEMLPVANSMWKVLAELNAGETNAGVVSKCEGLVRNSPETGLFYELLAHVHIARGELKLAEKWQRKRVTHCPGDTRSLDGLAGVLLLQNRYIDSIGPSTASLELDPNSARPHQNLGYAFLKTKRIPKSIYHFLQAVALDPQSHGSHKYLADAYTTSGDIVKAVQHYTKSLELGNGWSNAALPLAWILATDPDPQVRDPEKAVALAYGVCEESGYRDPLALDALAAAHAGRGRFARAVEVATEAIDIARAAGSTGLAAEILERKKLYEQKHVYISQQREQD